MKRSVTLYIGTRVANLEDDTFVVFNFAVEELSNPTIAKNSWSNEVTLPRTPDNDKLFGDVFRVDRVVGSGYASTGADFNPRRRTPFAIYASTGELLVDGYCKLNTVTPTAYKVTLYGGLGALLYALSYDDDGNALTLADLDYLQTGSPASEFDITLDRTAILRAWQQLSDGTHTYPIHDVINFAPAYNGEPDDFNADKCLFDGGMLGLGSGRTLLAALSRKYTEREMLDYRSYLQRPVIKVAAVLDAIVRKASALGYTLYYPATQGDPFIEDTWMTLPLLKGKRSGDTVTKADLLGGTCSPAQFLLGICKMFGWRLVSENKVVDICTRDEFYNGGTDDLTGRVDLSRDPELSPLLMDAKWYEFSSPDDGAFAKSYNERYGRSYGSQRIDTGYEFDADVKQLVDGLPFRGAVQSQEQSTAFRTGHKDLLNGTITDFPGAFLDGGTYTDPSAQDQTTNQLIAGRITWAWWNGTLDGYDIGDFPQLHGEDNKTIDGGGVLLFFTGMDAGLPDGAHLSDDTAAMTDGPCWNWTASGVTALAELPHFSRFLLDQGGDIGTSLDWGPAAELDIPGLQYASGAVGVYADFWRDFLRDRFDENTKRITVRVDLSGLQVGVGLLRRFWWWRGSLWAISKISNYSLTTFDPAEVELVQVRDKNNYR